MESQEFFKYFGKKVKAVREINDMNQETLADFMGMSQSGISAIENGERKADCFFLRKLCVLFNIAPSAFLSDKPVEIKGYEDCVKINNSQ